MPRSATMPHGPRAAQRLQSITGVGWVTAAWTLVTTLNFSTCDTVEALTAYAGLAPMPRAIRHERVASPGDRAYRQRSPPDRVLYGDLGVLYSITPSSRPSILAYAQLGSPRKSARCAAARKLLHLAWAVVKKDQPFDPYYVRGSKTT